MDRGYAIVRRAGSPTSDTGRSSARSTELSLRPSFAPYDPAVDPNTAQQVLRLSPDAPLTPSTVEAAFARESWERHPSRYPDEAGRAAATEWAATLAQARSVLLQSMTAADVAPWAPPAAGPSATAAGSAPMTWSATEIEPVVPAGASGPAPAPRSGRGRRVGLVAGIVAASAGVVALIAGAVFGATKVAEQFVDEVSVLAEQPEWTGETIRYSSDETLFTFPAAMEEYFDGRYWDECPDEFAGFCWQWAVIPEESCTSLEVDLEFTEDESAWTGDEREVVAFTDVEAGEVTPLVFGHHDYDWAWIADVRCLDEPAPAPSGASTTANAVTTPMARLEAGRWSSEDTGFYVLGTLEIHDDGRLDELCPDGFTRGCWQATIVPEDTCGRLSIQYSFRVEDGTDQSHVTWRTAEAGESVNVVFGNDDAEHGWISHVACMN
jgi:hypothetical protein